MAGTYYKYAEREADSYVDWGTIGKSLSDMLQKQNQIREDKKAAIDESSRQFGETLSNAPQGEQKQLNQWTLEYAADAQQARLLQDRLFKSGQLKLKDYTVMRQNLNDGTKQAFNLVKEYQEEYKNKMERIKQDKSQDLEGWLMQQAEGFGNFTKSKLYINPTNFQVSVAGQKKQIVDGKEVYVMDTDPNNYTTVNALRNRIKGTYDKYDVSKSIGAMVDSLGVEINSVERLGTLYQTGSISETLDITKRKNLPADAQGVIMKFEDAETKMLRAQLQNPYNTSSILTNTLGVAPNGKTYTFTFDEKVDRNANPEIILLKDSDTGSPMPVFTDAQEKAALERLRLEARLQYDKKQEIKAIPQAQLQERRAKTPYEMDEEQRKKDAEVFGQNLAAMLTGNMSQARQGADYFKAIKGINQLDLGTGGINISTNQGLLDYNFKPGGVEAKPKEIARSILKALNVGERLSEEDIMAAFDKYALSPTLTKQNVGKVGKIIADYGTEFGQYANTEVPKLVIEDDPESTVKKLTDTFGKLGFTFTGKEGTLGNRYTDKVTVKAPNGKSKEFIIDTKGNDLEIANFIRDNRDDRILEKSALFGSKVPSTKGGGELD